MYVANVTTKDLLRILDISRRLSEQHAVQPLAEYVARTIFEFIAADRCVIATFTEGDDLLIQAAIDRQGNVLPHAASQVSRTILSEVRSTLLPSLVADALMAYSPQSAESVHGLRSRSVMCAPLVAGEKAIGAIYVENRLASDTFHDSDLALLVLLANQVAVAIENARQYEHLEASVAARTRELQEANARLERQAADFYEQSIRDSLTGLYNRRYFSDALKQAALTVRRYRQPCSLAMLDVDHFKQINDSYSHLVGDAVLKELGRLLRIHVRATDVNARIGGEEFAIIMPMTSPQDAFVAVDRLRQTIAGHPWERLESGLRVTISAGIAGHQLSDDSSDLMRQADACLYEAKRGGRNRVIVAGEATEEAPAGRPD